MTGKYRDHHAYLVVGEVETARREVLEELAGEEVLEYARTQFTIEDSREARERASRRVAAGRRRYCLLAFETITVEAEQALLKTLEEPAAGSTFIIIAPSAAIFLPTVLSRIQVVRREGVAAADVTAAAQAFLAAGPEERLAIVGGWLSGDEAAAAKRALSTERLNAIEAKLYAAWRRRTKTVQPAHFDELNRARDYLRDRAAAPRLLLEHLALILPRLVV